MLAVRKPSLLVSKRVFFITVGAGPKVSGLGRGACGGGLGRGAGEGAGALEGAVVGEGAGASEGADVGELSKRPPALGEKQPAQR